jgi:acetolactate synthase I/II/III large subunit
MLAEAALVADAAPAAGTQPAIASDHLDPIRTTLERAERPLLLVGGPGWTDEACRQIVAFAEANGLPAACSFRRQDLFDNNSPCLSGISEPPVRPAWSSA